MAQIVDGIAGFLVWALIIYFGYKYFKGRSARRAEHIANESARTKQTDSIICPNVNCGFKGEAKKAPRGSTGVGIFLLFFMILPGVLYFMFKSGYRYSCPQCGLQIRADN